MNYTHYISTTFKHNGVPNLTNESFGLLMNIVHIEGKITALERLKKKEKNHRYNIDIQRCVDQLKTLTKGLTPQQLIIKLTSNY